MRPADCIVPLILQRCPCWMHEKINHFNILLLYGRFARETSNRSGDCDVQYAKTKWIAFLLFSVENALVSAFKCVLIKRNGEIHLIFIIFVQ